MIKICIPSNNIEERKYIIEVFFDEFLGLEYELEIKDVKNYEMILSNNSKLIIKDHFFSKFSKNLQYLDKKNIPQKVEFGKNRFTVEKDIPIIYGNNELEINDNQIICGIDIFASSFFMLTRWEEYVNKTRDIHNRFPAYASLAYKNNFLDRPIVNEYVEMLWNMLKFLGCKQERKERGFEIVLTHDVDEVKFWKSKGQLLRIVLGDILKRRNVKLALERLSEYYLVKRNSIKDPFDTFEWLMDKSEAIGTVSRFYFMSGGNSQYDNRYDVKGLKLLMRKIRERGHVIGFHPSYNSYNNLRQFREEKRLLEEVCECSLIEGRQHYLRFEVPTTWQIWEDCEMSIDSTCGYPEEPGFRCGTGDEFSVFNILTRKKLNLKERPLVFMDGTYYGYNKHTPANVVVKKIEQLIDISRRFNQKIIFLFHNSIFSFSKTVDFSYLYKTILRRNRSNYE